MPPPDLERLYDEHAQALFAFLLNFTRNEADTCDVLQEVLIKLARQPDLLDGVREERAFLLRVSHNAAINLMRRRGTREKNHEQLALESADAFAPAADPDEQAFRDGLASALGELPPGQRAVVHLKLWERLTFEAIAEALDIPLNTAASRYRYGLDKLRERLSLRRDQMKPDDFENQLQRQPLRPVPTEWRAEILQAETNAVAADVRRRMDEVNTAAQPIRLLTSAATNLAWWREWLWPSPKAWAGLAAGWIAIAVLNVTGAPGGAEMAKQSPKPSLEAATTLAAQRRELARLLDNPADPAAAPKPRATPPGPRSELLSPPGA